jgi:hypothetical protein
MPKPTFNLANSSQRGFMMLALNAESAMLDDMKTWLVVCGETPSRDDRKVLRAFQNQLRKYKTPWTTVSAARLSMGDQYVTPGTPPITGLIPDKVL